MLRRKMMVMAMAAAMIGTMTGSVNGMDLQSRTQWIR